MYFLFGWFTANLYQSPPIFPRWIPHPETNKTIAIAMIAKIIFLIVSAVVLVPDGMAASGLENGFYLKSNRRCRLANQDWPGSACRYAMRMQFWME